MDDKVLESPLLAQVAQAPTDSGSAPSVLGLMHEQRLCMHFQPLGNLTDGSILGHEALVRGPQGHPLAAPDALFARAREQELSLELEIHCVKLALQAWADQGMRGSLWVNLSANSLSAMTLHPQGQGMLDVIKTLSIATDRLVVELTEHERVNDMGQLLRATAVLRKYGTRLALDDFGDGRSSLRLWSELKPDFVKIDKYFANGIESSADKVQTITALKRIADTFDTKMVAEGMETSQALRVVRDLGVDYAQGYLLGRPQAQLVQTLPAVVQLVIASREIAVLPSKPRAARSDFSVAQIAQRIEPLNKDTTNKAVARRFEADEALKALAIVEGARPLALINRQSFYNQYSRPYFKELYDHRSCMLFANTQPLMLESSLGLDALTDVLTSEDQRYLSEGFIITDSGSYAGMGTGERLVRAVTELRIEAARHANPLTFLPGNIPLSLHIERLLLGRADFVACYADLNHFKPFNDHYGYWRGDEMIRLLASTIVKSCDGRRDFVGHVGGDDFVILFQSEDWFSRIEGIVERFNESARRLYDEPARSQGGIEAEDRFGVHRFFPLTRLSIGAMRVGVDDFASAEAVASAAAVAKCKAKQTPSGIYVDQLQA